MLLHYDYDKPLYVIGSGIVAQEIRDLVATETMGIVELRTPEEFYQLPAGSQCMLGFLTQRYRVKFLSEALKHDRRWPSYIHPNGFIDPSVTIKNGVFMYPLYFIGYGVTLGDFCSFGPYLSIGHGSQLGQNVSAAPSTIIGGSTTIGDNVGFGQKSSIKDKITITSDTSFYMNSVVTKDITEPGTYYGIRRVSVDTYK